MASNPFGVTREIAREIAKETSKCMHDFKRDFIDKYGVNISNKFRSQIDKTLGL